MSHWAGYEPLDQVGANWSEQSPIRSGMIQLEWVKANWTWYKSLGLLRTIGTCCSLETGTLAEI